MKPSITKEGVLLNAVHDAYFLICITEEDPGKYMLIYKFNRNFFIFEYKYSNYYMNIFPFLKILYYTFLGTYLLDLIFGSIIKTGRIYLLIIYIYIDIFKPLNQMLKIILYIINPYINLFFRIYIPHH